MIWAFVIYDACLFFQSMCMLEEKAGEFAMLEKPARKISREEEARLPGFSSHVEAREHFSRKYGASFVAIDSFPLGDKRICYEYHLVLDREAYARGMRALYKLSQGEAESSTSSSPGTTSGIQLLHSYQKIEIMDDGSVHILH